MTDNKKRLIGFIAATIVLVVAVIVFCVLRARLISGGDVAFREGPCQFSQLYHLYCPGCGGTRSIVSLLKFDIIGSIVANPVPVYAIALFMHVWAALLHNVIAGSKGRLWRIIYEWEVVGIIVVIAGNFILRNLFLVLFGIDPLGDMAGFW